MPGDFSEHLITKKTNDEKKVKEDDTEGRTKITPHVEKKFFVSSEDGGEEGEGFKLKYHITPKD